jgi:hypothetical protein
MFRGLGSFVRLLVGVLMVQAVTVLVAVVAQRGEPGLWPLYAALAAAVGVMAAFWFNAIVGDHRRIEAARVARGLAREAEALREKVERQAARRVREAEGRAQAMARAERARSWRAGLGLGGATAVGVMLMLGQMLAVGALVLGAAGAGAVWWRVRRARAAALGAPSGKPLIEGQRVA